MTSMQQRFYQFIIFNLMIANYCVRTEWFTALVEMEELVETESVLIADLDKYVRIQEERVAILKSKITTNRQSVVAHVMPSYKTNPIKAHLLMKRLIIKLQEIVDLISNDLGAEFLKNITNYRHKLKFPTEEDLNGTANSLLLLQNTYNLKTSSVARGHLNGIQTRVHMTSSDCFVLGRQSFTDSEFYLGTVWMRQAMFRMTHDEKRNSTYKADILEYLAFSIFTQGNTSLKMTNELLELRPSHARAVKYKVYLENKMRKVELQQADDQPVRQQGTNSSRSDTPKNLVYRILCRNEMKQSENKLGKLRCKYVTNKSEFLKIAPLKLEEVHLDPYIVLYHEIMYDSEIEVFMKMARPKFMRASTMDKSGEPLINNMRTSKSAWLEEHEHRYVRNVDLRIEDMTGLSVSTAEPLQVVNYGVGGHYEPHCDYFNDNQLKVLCDGTGNRVATVLFYMSDVSQGGATVFPVLKTAIWPKKGTAAFWMNLYKSGEGNSRTKHAACPVLTGNKWVSNKWLHLAGQEYLRPCGMQPDHPSNEEICF